jgi:hypothetical protein
VRALAPLFFSLFALLGCSKLAVFSPEDVEARLGYDERLDAPIVRLNADGATLENGRILSRKKTPIARLEEGTSLLSIDGQFALAADAEGGLILYDPSGAAKKFAQKEAIVSAATDGKIIVVVSKTNACKIIDAADGKTLFFSQEKPTLAVSDRLAKPLVGAKQAIIPTLDGKLLIVDRASAKTVKEIAVGGEEFFGNVVLLADYENRIIVAIDGRILSIAPNGTQRTRDIDARFFAALPSGLYAFARDGAVQRLNAALETLSIARLPYARFIAAIEKNGDVWAVEQSGYVARFSDNLQKTEIYELPDAIRASVYVDDRGVWHYDKLARWR